MGTYTRKIRISPRLRNHIAQVFQGAPYWIARVITPEHNVRGSRFPRSSRILKTAQYDRVKLDGSRAYGKFLLISYLSHQHGQSNASRGARLGIAVTKKVAPRAVDRNRIKRVLRETFRRIAGGIALNGNPLVDIVVVARRDIASATALHLSDEFCQILRQEGLLAR